MMRCGRWSARSMIIALVLAVSLACGAQPAAGPVTSAPPELGTAIDDYLAHASANFYNAETASPKLVRRALMEGPEVDPGTFVYSNVGPHLLSAVLVQATGMSTLAYARRELFDPLGINSQPAFEGPIAQRDNPAVVSTNSFPRRLQRAGQVRAADHRRPGSAGRHRDLLTHIGYRTGH